MYIKFAQCCLFYSLHVQFSVRWGEDIEGRDVPCQTKQKTMILTCCLNPVDRYGHCLSLHTQQYQVGMNSTNTLEYQGSVLSLQRSPF